MLLDCVVRKHLVEDRKGAETGSRLIQHTFIGCDTPGADGRRGFLPVVRAKQYLHGGL